MNRRYVSHERYGTDLYITVAVRRWWWWSWVQRTALYDSESSGWAWTWTDTGEWFESLDLWELVRVAEAEQRRLDAMLSTAPPPLKLVGGKR